MVWVEDGVVGRFLVLCLGDGMGGGIMINIGNMGDNKLRDIVGVKSIFEWSCENVY